ncbi:MAG: ACP S-malonyltransferase [Fretibacterium sp.]|nr:ACP S-malonyltransferase [Fretibacterium sp.]
MRYALCFPGQGAQEVGMGKALYDAFPAAREVFEEADDALSFHMSKLIFEGPDEQLKLTANTQPAIMTTSIAALRVLEREMELTLTPLFGAGHSLGEYTALVAAGALSFRDGVTLVQKRGQWMQDSAPEGVGAMAAILGLKAEEVVEVCQEVAPEGECQPANFNSPGQVVISGLVEYVDEVVKAAKARGAKKAVMLNVSAPFHSRLMQDAAERLKKQFDEHHWSAPRWPIVANATAEPVATVKDVREALYLQTFSPVLWENSVVRMADDGVEAFFELGPGSVLTGLNKRCRKGLTLMAAGTPETLEGLAEVLRSQS